MLGWNKKFGRAYITSGVGYGRTKLAAFDKAELDANIVATNAIKVTSFVPSGWNIIRDKRKLGKITSDGTFLPMAYAYKISNKRRVSASVIIGINRSKTKASIIAEHADSGITREDSLESSENCIREAFAFRKWKLGKLEKASVDALPKDGLYACALVAVLFFPE